MHVLCNYGKKPFFSPPCFICFSVMPDLSTLAWELLLWPLCPAGDLKAGPLGFCPSPPLRQHTCALEGLDQT